MQQKLNAVKRKKRVNLLLYFYKWEKKGFLHQVPAFLDWLGVLYALGWDKPAFAAPAVLSCFTLVPPVLFGTWKYGTLIHLIHDCLILSHTPETVLASAHQ